MDNFHIIQRLTKEHYNKALSNPTKTTYVVWANTIQPFKIVYVDTFDTYDAALKKYNEL